MNNFIIKSSPLKENELLNIIIQKYVVITNICFFIFFLFNKYCYSSLSFGGTQEETTRIKAALKLAESKKFSDTVVMQVGRYI